MWAFSNFFICKIIDLNLMLFAVPIIPDPDYEAIISWLGRELSSNNIIHRRELMSQAPSACGTLTHCLLLTQFHE